MNVKFKKIVHPTVFKLYKLQINKWSFNDKKSMLRARFFMFALSKASEGLTAGTLNFWELFSNQNIRIIRSIYSIKDTASFHNNKDHQEFLLTVWLCHNNTRKIAYFLACQKIYRAYINKSKRLNAENGQIIHHEVYCLRWRTYSLDTSQICIV